MSPDRPDRPDPDKDYYRGAPLAEDASPETTPPDPNEPTAADGTVEPVVPAEDGDDA